MSIPVVFGVAVLAGIIIQRLCELVRARLRSRRWIGYLHYSIGERTTPTNPAAASRPDDSSGSTVGFGDTVGNGHDRRPAGDGQPIFMSRSFDPR